MLRSLLFVLVPVSLAVASIACNGQVGGGEPSGSTSSRSLAGKADRDATKSSSGSSPTSSGASTGTDGPSCDYERGSSSSGGDGQGHYSCELTQHFTCDGAVAEQEITCRCDSVNGQWQPGSCSCGGSTFAFDCSHACGPGPAEYAKCGLPVPDEDGPSGGGSTTSSSGLSSGSTSGSTSGASGSSGTSGSSGSTTSSSGH